MSKKEKTHAAILAGAGRTFRSQGFGGAGVDALAKAGGVTSGAFYAHFPSKLEAFREAVASGMRDLERGIRGCREHYTASPSVWIEHFVEFYLGEKRTCDLTEGCALQSMTGDVARADMETRRVFAAELRGVLEAAAAGIEAPSAKARRSDAIVMLALLSGGVSLARAVDDPAFSDEIANAIRAALRHSLPGAGARRGTPVAKRRRTRTQTGAERKRVRKRRA